MFRLASGSQHHRGLQLHGLLWLYVLQQRTGVCLSSNADNPVPLLHCCAGIALSSHNACRWALWRSCPRDLPARLLQMHSRCLPACHIEAPVAARRTQVTSCCTMLMPCRQLRKPAPVLLHPVSVTAWIAHTASQCNSSLDCPASQVKPAAQACSRRTKRVKPANKPVAQKAVYVLVALQ
jgi:hypothetical protein